ncbi:hypothetical protein PUR71_25265 [Streptomyces sp. SP17BM10]|uniref:hypothetical protein n=1 Tax=Streptomyces sp. SP17BM10 TaxID=3002530 RepID=UPI002E79C8C2|nr:hypothetical protein [Streptomyces sp. SP17BM10]MEE1786183.1 hypothetical protein [Streptomyces sp. SP17BM10]
MEINELLRNLADEYVQGEPTEFHRIGDLKVVEGVVFSCPAPPEWSVCGDVPPGSHPVYVGVRRFRDHETGREESLVEMVFVPLAGVAEIAGAEWEDAIEDWQPLGPDVGFLWDSTAMDAFRDRSLRPESVEELGAFVERVEAELDAADAAGRVPAWVDVVVNEKTGANVLAFRVCDESALCLEGRDDDGNLVGLLFSGTM